MRCLLLLLLLRSGKDSGQHPGGLRWLSQPQLSSCPHSVPLLLSPMAYGVASESRVGQIEKCNLVRQIQAVELHSVAQEGYLGASLPTAAEKQIKIRPALEVYYKNSRG